MIASSRTALTSSGRISGVGLASANISGRGAIVATMSCLSTPRGRQAEEDVGAGDDSAELALRRVLREARLVVVHELGSAAGTRRPRCRRPRCSRAACPSSTSSSRQASAAAPAPLHTSLTVADFLADDLEAVEDRGADDDRGAVLVVVEDRDLHAAAQLALDVEALRRLDVLEVDAAEGRLERGDHLDQLVRIGLVDLDVEDVDAGELLEQDALAFHHRLGSERTDGAEPEHRGAVGDDADQVAARGVAERRRGIRTIALLAAATPGEYASARSRWLDSCLVGVTAIFPGAGTRGTRARPRRGFPLQTSDRLASRQAWLVVAPDYRRCTPAWRGPATGGAALTRNQRPAQTRLLRRDRFWPRGADGTMHA